jgi:PAS domain S-box-containing protein
MRHPLQVDLAGIAERQRIASGMASEQVGGASRASGDELFLPVDIVRTGERFDLAVPAWSEPAGDDSILAMRESLDALVRLIERVAPGMRGSVLILGADGVTLHHGAAPNLPEAYCRAIDGSRIGPAAGSCGTAAWRRERVIVGDIASDPLWVDYRALAAQYGLAACWSTPIVDERGQVLGTFAMYYGEPREPGEMDLALTETATLLARNIILRARATAALRARTVAAERTAQVLHESEARFREMAETIPVQVWTARPDGQLDFVTRRTAEHLGRQVEELLDSGWIDAVHPDDAAPAVARWKRSLATGEPYETQFRLFVDGEYRWHLVRAHAIRAADGRVTQWFGCNADIEDYKRLEAALDAALADAREANRAKAEFLAMMSHELRTPLNAIGGYAQLMLDGIPTPPSDGQRNYLQRIARSKQHLLGLIEAVLMRARLEAGKVTYRIEDARVGELLDVVDSLTQPQRAAKRLAWDCDGCERGMILRADQEKVVQILVNVVSNAAKFTPEGGSITVTTTRPATGVGAIAVRDTGVGMSPEQARRVFDPYVQFDNKLSRDQEGTGLGMTISRELARGMDGELVVESEPDVGTTFTLTLPLA